MFQTVPCD